MPEAAAAVWRTRHDLAVEQLHQYLLRLPGAVRKLTAEELQCYHARHVHTGWRLEVSFADGIRRLDLLVDHRLPHVPPRIALVDRPPFLTWPHIEDDGILCVLPDTTEVASTAVIAVVQHVLSAAVHLIEQCIAGVNQEDFSAEFLSYWNRTVETQTVEWYSVLRPAPPSRIVRVWRGQHFFLVSEDEQATLAWLRHRYGESKKQPQTTEPAVLLWLDHPLHPQEYPQTAADVRRLAHQKTVDGHLLLAQLASKSPTQIVVLLGADTPHGPCLAGVVITAPHAMRQGTRRRIDALTCGFRPDKVPSEVLVHRYFGPTLVRRTTVARADHAWVHGRDHDPRHTQLHAAKVGIIGCGSVGGPVAVKLAEAGIGSLILIDPDQLRWANVGRHPLGAGAVGRKKALSLASRLQRDYPHLSSIEAYTCTWEDLTQRDPAPLMSCDLLVSATGSWNAEGALNQWHLLHGRRPTMVYGWTEPHACAGHAVAILSEGGCLQCGFSESGEPALRVTAWSEGVLPLQEPACGAVYQPYGPAELTYIEALIVELALDCLLCSVQASHHRIWVARRSVLEAAGGTWHPAWAVARPGAEEGGVLAERSWVAKPGCPACAAAGSC